MTTLKVIQFSSAFALGALVLTLSGCIAPNAVEHKSLTLVHKQVIFDTSVSTVSGCRVRWSSSNSISEQLEWSGDCDSEGFAYGPGTLTDRYLTPLGPGIGKTETTMVRGLSNGQTTITDNFPTLHDVKMTWVSKGLIQDGNRVGDWVTSTYKNGIFDGSDIMTYGDDKVSLKTLSEGLADQGTAVNEDDDTGSIPSADVQIFSAVLNTAIQARGMKDAAASQRAYQTAANQQARTNAAALAQAQLAAAQAQQATSQAKQQAQAQQGASSKPHSQNATQCVRQDGNQLINTCSETITVVWCVVGDGSNCDRGLDMESEIRAGGSTPALPLKHPNIPISVHYAACTGWMTAVAQGMQAKCD
jgi:hypothetical protein